MGLDRGGHPLTTKRREYDEDDVRIRPGRSSRPRTRIRPRHEGADRGFVIAVDRGRYTVEVAGAPVTAMRARELGRRGVVVGDRVALVGDISGAPGSLARIVRIEERVSVLRRTADDDETTPEGRVERVVVANADQLVIVSALADPPPRTGFIDRCLVAAYDAEIDPLLCLTKSDLAGPQEVLDYYAELDLPYVLCRPDGDLGPLRDRLAGRISVLVGHSGVGKSTLVNRLVPDADRRVGLVSAIGKGRHTSTSAVALPLPPRPGHGGTDGGAIDGGETDDGTEREIDVDGWIIDTPGIRSFGLAHVSAESLLHGFPDLVQASVNCPPGCDHTGTAGTCGLDALVAAGGADSRRLASYRRLLASREGAPDPGDDSQ
ncbi:ribosome small subunit-dependent GTPase A [Rugosimonospora acidiphila]|uniref:Ribosome small subunit-dependent GTPase A n=1 Tax=Rugosimonospora acidiphila TaxID=556531 RepID=A0ABP9RPI3_9ACTN